MSKFSAYDDISALATDDRLIVRDVSEVSDVDKIKELPISLLDDRFVNESDHGKAAHDALGIDADTVDGQHADAFAAVADGVTNGDSHDHSGGDGAQIDHVNLANIGTNTHAQIDTHLADTTIHITSAQNDALDASSSPSGDNPVLTLSALDRIVVAQGQVAVAHGSVVYN